MSWEEIGRKAQGKLLDSIPSEWRISGNKLPSATQVNITDFPVTSGLLTKGEAEITQSLASDIVQKIAAAEWSAEDVTRAFCKRAAIAHQLVSAYLLFRFAVNTRTCRPRKPYQNVV